MTTEPPCCPGCGSPRPDRIGDWCGACVGRGALRGGQPRIVCLCGSTRFWRDFQAAGLVETLAGRIVLSIGAATGTNDEHFGDRSPEDRERVEFALHQLHLHKIDLADEVLILNRDGYIGPSTAGELAYAWQAGKGIRYLEPERAPAEYPEREPLPSRMAPDFETFSAGYWMGERDECERWVHDLRTMADQRWAKHEPEQEEESPPAGDPTRDFVLFSAGYQQGILDHYQQQEDPERAYRAYVDGADGPRGASEAGR